MKSNWKFLIMSLACILLIGGTAVALDFKQTPPSLEGIDIDREYENILNERGLTQKEVLDTHKKAVVLGNENAKLTDAKRKLFIVTNQLYKVCPQIEVVDNIRAYTQAQINQCN